MPIDIAEFIKTNPEYAAVLRRFIAKQIEADAKESINVIKGLQWKEVPGCSWRQLQKLFELGFLSIPFSSNKSTYYYCDEPDTILATLDSVEQMSVVSENHDGNFPVDLFDIIVGYDDVKDLVRLSMTSKDPTSIIFIGPPASCKTLFCMEVARLPCSAMVVGQTTTKAGIVDFLLSHDIKYLILDELDKLRNEEQDALLEVMQNGTITVTKHNQRLQKAVPTWVYATANREDSISPALLSRFTRLHFKPYDEPEYMEICRRVLIRNAIPAGMANVIASRVWNELGSRDVRDAIHIGRLVKTEGDVDRVVGILQRYRR